VVFSFGGWLNLLAPLLKVIREPTILIWLRGLILNHRSCYILQVNKLLSCAILWSKVKL
jgi:hypothetical protein